tara:strand:+ start:4296 stop:4580 length:285 start_codon:yes stop_codon:yes gene_type:complete
MTKFSSPFLAKSPLNNNGNREIKNDTIYNWNNKQVNKRFSDSITIRDKVTKPFFEKAMEEGDIDFAIKMKKERPGPGTLTKSVDGKTVETQTWN